MGLTASPDVVPYVLFMPDQCGIMVVGVGEATALLLAQDVDKLVVRFGSEIAAALYNQHILERVATGDIVFFHGLCCWGVTPTWKIIDSDPLWRDKLSQ